MTESESIFNKAALTYKVIQSDIRFRRNETAELGPGIFEML